MPPLTVGELPLPRDAPPPSFLVEIEREFSQTADRCEVRLRVEGSRYVTGHAALEQAEEVRKVVAAVVAAGVPRDAVALTDVSVKGRTGVLTTATSAAYTLRVEVRDLAKLADLLTTVTGPKTCRLVGTEYRFDDDPGTFDGWLAEVMAAVRGRAAALAAAAGVTLGPVREVSHRVRPWASREGGYPMPDSVAGDDDLVGFGVRRRVAEDLPGPVVRERTVKIEAGLRFEIGPPVDPGPG